MILRGASRLFEPVRQENSGLMAAICGPKILVSNFLGGWQLEVWGVCWEFVGSGVLGSCQRNFWGEK